MNDGLPPRDHNQPPEPTPIERAEQLVPACDGWTTKGPLTSETEAQVLSEFLGQIRTVRAQLIEERDTAAKPYEDALATIKARFGQPITKLDIAIERIAGSKKVVGLLADWMARERKRIADEAEAKKRAAEEAERIAQTMADRAAVEGTIDSEIEARQAIEEADKARDDADRRPERVRVKGDLAPKAVGLRDYWSATIDNWKLAGQHYKREPRVIRAFRDAVQLCADADARRLKDVNQAPPGVSFHKREQAQ
jgi:hypothetical protein